MVSAVCCVPGGAAPSYAQGYYDRDNPFYRSWDAIARDRETFTQFIERHILSTEDFAGFKRVYAETSAAKARAT